MKRTRLQKSSGEHDFVIPRSTMVLARRKARSRKLQRMARTLTAMTTGVAAAALFMACSSTVKSARISPGPSDEPGSRLLGFFAALQEPRSNAEPHCRLAQLYQKRGMHREAIIEFGKALLIAPDHVDALNGMGVSYDMLGRYEAALSSYAQALIIKQDSAAVWNNLGYSYLLQDDLDLAISSFSKAVSLESHIARYHMNLGLAYAKKGMLDLALNEFRVADGSVDAQATLEQVLAGMNRMTDGGNAVSFLPIAAVDASTLPQESTAGTRETAVPQRSSVGRMTALAPPQQPKEPDKTAALTAAVTERLIGRSGQVEVANGNGISRMARRVGSFLKEKGVAVTWLTNASDFNRPQTTIYYRSGNEDLAAYVERSLPGTQETEKSMLAGRPEHIRVRVVLGKDLVAYNDQMNGVMR